MKLYSGQRCGKCGAFCEPGTRVIWNHAEKCVAGCPKCAPIGHVAEVAAHPKGITVAESLRRKGIRAAKKRKKEGNKP